MTTYDYAGNVLDVTSTYNGKTLSILGDSISTFTGYVVAGNAVYYTGSNCGVSAVTDTWWMKLITALGMTLDTNNSYSGSYVTTHSSETTAGCMTRCQNLGSPDVIIVWMGINDFNNEVAIGSYDGSQTFPTATTTFREAYSIMLNKILTAYKTAEVWVCTLPYDERSGDTGFPEANGNDVLLYTWNEAIRELAKLFGVKVLELAQCGMTYQNMDTYTGDWNSSTSAGLHPNAAGHSLIANQCIRQMDDAVRTRY